MPHNSYAECSGTSKLQNDLRMFQTTFTIVLISPTHHVSSRCSLTSTCCKIELIDLIDPHGTVLFLKREFLAETFASSSHR